MGQRENVYEMVAMYITALPVPPLPVWVRIASNQTQQDGETEGYASSHDLLAGLLVAAMVRDRPDLNRKRMARQKALLDELDAALRGRPASAFEAYVRFTGQFLLAFGDDASAPQVRFGGLDDVAPGDKLHSACAHWMASQDILHSTTTPGGERRTAAQFLARSYGELLAEHAINYAARPPEEEVDNDDGHQHAAREQYAAAADAAGGGDAAGHGGGAHAEAVDAVP
jgi:hypothetical protein